MSRLCRFYAFVFVASMLLLPTSVGAQDSVLSYTYLPIAMGGGASSGPDLIQFRSCGGYDGIPLQYQEVPVGELTALTEQCSGGESYPGPIAGDNEGVAVGGYWWKDYNWHLVPHIGKFYDQDVQFHVNMGIGGAPPPYLSVNIQNGQLNVFRGSEVYTSTIAIEDWEVTFHLNEAKPYVLFTRDLSKIWVVMDRDDGILWIEVQTPRVKLLTTTMDISRGDVSQPPGWGVWYYAQCHGHMPSLDVMESEHYIIARYPFN